MSVAARLCLVACVLCPAVRADDPPKPDLMATLRQLEQEIAKVRGLAFKSPVVAKIVPRKAGDDRGIQGYYSPAEKTLYVYDDVKGNYAKGVLIHEMAHALQDQHFGLAKLHQQSFSSDAELALAALIEGDATLTMIELLQKDQPKAGAMLDVPLEKSRNLRNAFLYAQGARYVRALKAKDGWKAVDRAYRFPPRTTAAVLHPDDGVTAIDLGSGKTIGEYGLIALLHDHAETAPVAASAAAGWRGDRLTEEGTDRTWRLAFATETDAARCQSALTKRQLARFPKKTDLSGGAWLDDKGAAHVVYSRNDRVFALDAANEVALAKLRASVEALPKLRVYAAKGKQPLSFGELIDKLEAADIVCVGENHDSELHHYVQHQIIKGLFARDERLAVGMEMFQRPFQPALDAYLGGTTNEADFLKASDYRARWGYSWSLYRPIVEFCRKNSVPVAALNASKELTGRISKVGMTGLTDDEKKQLGPVDIQVKAHRDQWFDLLAKMHGPGQTITKEQQERSYQVMATWDDAMAASAARFLKERGVRRIVVLAGGGHVEHRFGIPDRAAKYAGGKALSVKVAAGGEPEKLLADGSADFLVIVSR